MRRIFYTFILIFISATAIAQESATDTITQKLMGYAISAKEFGKMLPQEKVYLHLDNTSYFQGDNLWFQAYIVTAERNKPSGLSKTLYVELLNPGGTLVDKCILPIEEGRCAGNFKLNKLPFYSGFYEIRAYTKYMLNFGKDVIYSRIIPVFDKPQESGNYRDMRMLKMDVTKNHYPIKRKVEKADKVINMRFYPEGGNLVAGLNSRVAFEATDENGTPMNVTGKVVSKSGATLAEFKSGHEGRGTFDYRPSLEQAKAQVEIDGKVHSFELPKAQERGMVIRVDNLSSNDSISIKVNKKGVNDKIIASAVICGGILSSYTIVGMEQGDSIEYKVNKRRLPAGVARIVLADAEGKIIADRLAFTHFGKRSSINVTTDKKSYEPNDLVKLNLTATDPFGNPSQAPISLAVRDGERLVESRNSMLADLLLMSEIKGYVHQPLYYFESTDLEHRTALDELLMIQGWRRYNWDWWAGTEDFDFKYLPEQGIEVHGQVLRHGTDKPMTDIQLSSLISIRGTEKDSELDDESYIAKKSTESNAAKASASLTANATSMSRYGRGRFSRFSRASMESSSLAFNDEYYPDSKKKTTTPKNDSLSGKNSSQAGIVDVDSMGRFSMLIGDTKGKWHLTLAVTNDKNRRKFSRILLDRNFSPEPKAYTQSDLQFVLTDENDNKVTRSYSSNADSKNFTNPDDALTDSIVDNESFLAIDKRTHKIKEVVVKAAPSLEEEIYQVRSNASVYYDIPSEIDAIRDSGERITDIHKLLRELNDKFVITRNSVATNAVDTTSTESHSALASSNFSNNVDTDFNASSEYLTMKRSPYSVTYLGKEVLFIVDYEKDWSNVAAYDILNLVALKSIYVSEDKSAIMQYYNSGEMTATEALSRYACVVFIELYPEDKIPVEPKRGIRKTWVDGYSEPAEFYSPDYSKKPKTDDDYRRTLYWNPMLKPDAEGKVSVEFYNSSNCKKLNLSAESLSSDGSIGVLK
ncbi:MAG: hypothetical protein IJZ49_08395 [Alistipes sp.]|nr:hypothetical protein [Alistipes sp.]